MLDSSFVFAATVTNSRFEGIDIPASTNGQPVFQFKVGTNLHFTFPHTDLEIIRTKILIFHKK